MPVGYQVLDAGRKLRRRRTLAKVALGQKLTDTDKKLNRYLTGS
jgi:hypothetical protein